ncbi:MAG: hypothetical protein LBI62_05210 [Candidatus Accumulibacter sp.]|jgi:hypothetical protein|nr:hypothetical protein [Accumulibacter sp.]
MKIRFFLVCLAVALPTFALELGPAGVPGAPGLVPVPSAESLSPPEPSPALAPKAPAKIPAACAKAKNVERCVARQEQRRKARLACRGKKDKAFQQCVNERMNPRKK